MSSKLPSSQLHDSRRVIADKVRELRKSRQWTQRHLADRLGLSQSRFSEIERAGGSFTAEQFLELLRLFNVDVSEFDHLAGAAAGELQNALIRHGAGHLRQARNASISQRYGNAAGVVEAVLLDPFSERFVTALAPVLVFSCDEIGLSSLQRDLVRWGRPHRLPWLVDNTVQAIDVLAFEAHHTRWKRRAFRARVVLRDFLDRLPTPAAGSSETGRDPMDPSIRSQKTLDRRWEKGSDISRKWHIVTALQVEDFVDALRQSREPH